LNGSTGNNLFSVGEVHGSGDFIGGLIGGLIGGNNGTVTNSFRDRQTSTADDSEAGS